MTPRFWVKDFSSVSTVASSASVFHLVNILAIPTFSDEDVPVEDAVITILLSFSFELDPDGLSELRSFEIPSRINSNFLLLLAKRKVSLKLLGFSSLAESSRHCVSGNDC